MRRLGIFLLILLALGLAALGVWIATKAESAPPWQRAWRESKIALSQVPKRGARVEAEISFKGQGGSSSFALALSRGINLAVKGEVADRGGSLLFALSGGKNTSYWRELRRGSRSILALGGLPYRAGRESFLEVDWFEALWPGSLLEVWPLFKNSAGAGVASDNTYNYSLFRFKRREVIETLNLPLLLSLGFKKQGEIGALIIRRNGSPGGLTFQRTLTGQEFDSLLGLSQPSGAKRVTVSIRYEVLRWGKTRPPAMPPEEALQPSGRAALEVALLPFFVGLQGGQFDPG